MKPKSCMLLVALSLAPAMSIDAAAQDFFKD